MKAELLVVMRGLGVARNGGHRRVMVSVDFEVVVRLLGVVIPPNSSYICVIRIFHALIRKREKLVKVEYCYQEANRVADWLANYSLELEEKFVLLEAVSLDLQAVLLEEMGEFLGLASFEVVATRLPILAVWDVAVRSGVV